MSDVEILKQMIRDAARVSLTVENGRVSVKLTEPQASNSSVTIRGMPSDAVVIKVDAFKSPDTLFAGTKGECKRADYVIIADVGKKKRILYIEMKKRKDSQKEIVAQLNGAACFVRYCQEIGRTFWGERNFLKDYQPRLVSFGHTSIPKRKTRITRQTSKHDKPESMMKIDWPHKQQFHHLVGA